MKATVPGTGTKPFHKEGNFQVRMVAELDKTLYSSIPEFSPGINDWNLRLAANLLHCKHEYM
jgi:hypothetical protein